MSRGNNIKVIGSAVIAALLAATYFFVFMPYQQSIETAQEEVTYQDDANTRISAENEKLRQLATLIPVAQKYDAELVKRFPMTSEADVLRASILGVASQNDISGITVSLDVPSVVLVEQQPLPEAPVENLDPLESDAAPNAISAPSTSNLAFQVVSLTGTGKQKNVAQFLSGLEEMERSIIITSFSANTGAENETSFSITAYSYLHAGVSLTEAQEETPVSPDENNSDIIGEPVP